MLSKAHLIESIMNLNPSATNTWLEGFAPDQLTRYLDHLQHALEPRGSGSAWLRDGNTAAVVTRRAAA